MVVLLVALVLSAAAARLAGTSNSRVASAELAFVSLFAESLPFLLVGAALSSLLLSQAGQRLLRAAARRPRLAAAMAPAVGFALPLCDCGLLPIARQLNGRGSSRAVGSFLAGAPLTNPIVIVSTILAFPGQPGMVAARVAGGLALAVAVGLLVPSPTKLPSLHEHVHEDHDGSSHADAEAAPRWLHALGAEFQRTAPTLALGALAAATLKAAVPAYALTGLDSQPLLGAVAMMVLAFILSICSQADAFVAAALPVGALPRLAFLLLGPVLDLRLSVLYRREFGARWVLRYAAVVVPATLIIATAAATAGLL